MISVKMVPFKGKVVNAKKRCHWCGTRGSEDLISCLSCEKEFFCVDCIDKRYLELSCFLYLSFLLMVSLELMNQHLE